MFQSTNKITFYTKTKVRVLPSRIWTVPLDANAHIPINGNHTLPELRGSTAGLRPC